MALSIDEEITLLEDAFRKLKIEFDIYFVGGRKLPPHDAQWRIETTFKRLEAAKLSFAHRFRVNAVLQKYAVHADMWRTKIKKKEEGRDAPPRPAAPPPPPPEKTPTAYKVRWQDPEKEQDKVKELYTALIEAKKKVGESPDTLNIEGFKRFVKAKTDQLKKDMRCENVEYVVEVENGQVRLKAKGT